MRPTIGTLFTESWIEYQPRGRCLVIAPWNFPLNLCFGPLVSALAAGNTVILKPSRDDPFGQHRDGPGDCRHLPVNEVALFEGSLPTSTALLELPFDHIFFTGSPAVGKVVMTAAAKHLTSVTLELGGKSPVIVDETANLRQAAEVMLWGKLTNCGQICVAPDHVFVHETVKERFVAECRKVLADRYGATPEAQRVNRDLTGVINQRHTQRIANLLQDALSKGAKALTGGEVDVAGCYIAPTLLDQVPRDAAIMREEIFGPLLPVLTFRNVDEVVRQINEGPSRWRCTCSARTRCARAASWRKPARAAWPSTRWCCITRRATCRSGGQQLGHWQRAWRVRLQDLLARAWGAQGAARSTRPRCCSTRPTPASSAAWCRSSWGC